MSDVGGGSGAYPELRATGLDAIEAQGNEFAYAATYYEERARTYRRAAAELESTNSGATIDEMVIAHHIRARKHDMRVEVQHELAKGQKKVVGLGRALNSKLDQIHHETQQEIEAAGPVLPAVRAAIIAAGYTRAVAAHSMFAAAVESTHSRAVAQLSQPLTAILGRDIPKDENNSAQALDNSGSHKDPKPEGSQQEDTSTETAGSHSDPTTKGTKQEAIQPHTGMHGDTSGNSAVAGSGPTAAGTHSDAEMPAVIQAVSPRPSVSAPPFAGGGAPSGVPGGGLLGGGNPLSSLTSGLGQPGAGLGGLANGASMPNAAAQAAQAAQMGQSPGAAIAKSLAASVGGGAAPLAPLSPATTTGVSSLGSAGGAAKVPAAGASSIAPSSGLGAAGAHVAPVASAPAPVSVPTGAAAPGPAMMVPPPGMGAPAAAGSIGAPVVPASGGSSSSGSAGGAGSAGGGVPNTPTMVPAGVLTPVAAAGAARTESAELRTARALAAKLRRDSDFVHYPVVEWAVGVFRADSSATPETVVMSSEGFGYIPWGVFLPRGVRLLASDPIVKTGFEKRWTGWSDPSRVLVEYAALRAQLGGGRLVAAAATNRIEPFKPAGIEHALCKREDYAQSPPTGPVLDAVHVDRFEATYPDLSARVQRLRAADHQGVLDEVVQVLAGQMMQGVFGGQQMCPVSLRDMWERLLSNEAVSQEIWQEFNTTANNQYWTAAVYRPGAKDVDPGDDATPRDVYEQQWLIARTMEVLRGFQFQPEPLGNMIYAAGVNHPEFGAHRLLVRSL